MGFPNIKVKGLDRYSAMEIFGKMLLNPIGLTLLLYAKQKGDQFSEKQITCDFKMPKRKLLRVVKWMETSKVIYKKREHFKISNLGIEILSEFEELNKRLDSKIPRSAYNSSFETTAVTTTLDIIAVNAFAISTGVASCTVVGTLDEGILAMEKGYISVRSSQTKSWAQVFFDNKHEVSEYEDKSIGPLALLALAESSYTITQKNQKNFQELSQ